MANLWKTSPSFLGTADFVCLLDCRPLVKQAKRQDKKNNQYESRTKKHAHRHTAILSLYNNIINMHINITQQEQKNVCICVSIPRPDLSFPLSTPVISLSLPSLSLSPGLPHCVSPSLLGPSLFLALRNIFTLLYCAFCLVVSTSVSQCSRFFL